MRKALADGKLVVAAPDSPDVAVCPSCGGMVAKRKRRRLDGQVTYFYRHKRGVGQRCPRRYHYYELGTVKPRIGPRGRPRPQREGR